MVSVWYLFKGWDTELGCKLDKWKESNVGLYFLSAAVTGLEIACEIILPIVLLLK